MDLRPELVGLKHVRFSHVISMNFPILFRIEMCSTLMLCPLTFLMTLIDHGPTGRSLLRALLALEWQCLCVSLALTKRRIKFLWQCLLAPCMQAAKDWFEVRLDDLEMKYLRNLEKHVQKSWRMLPKSEWQGHGQPFYTAKFVLDAACAMGVARQLASHQHTEVGSWRNSRIMTKKKRRTSIGQSHKKKWIIWILPKIILIFIKFSIYNY